MRTCVPLFATGCVALPFDPAALTVLHDPCGGRALPVALALTDTHVLLGCSERGGLWQVMTDWR